MKVKLGDLVNSISALNSLSQEKMSGKLAYTISRNLRLINSELETFNKTRSSLLEQYGTLVPDKTQYKFEPEQAKKYEDEINSLLSTELDLDLRKLTMSDIETIHCTPGDLMVLYWIINSDEGGVSG